MSIGGGDGGARCPSGAPLVFLSEAFEPTKRYQQLRVGIELLKARIIRIIKIAWRRGKSESMLSSTKAYHRLISPLVEKASYLNECWKSRRRTSMSC